ncbi:MAG: twin-arginine translocase TatA/TatE family subunit [Bacteroidetes bacterium HGW-Bacteroidetes-4]|jgi:sec-independent protein translocase protein TatA|nr:MAG: twin-arginine translocase TatA/TatE family subunit [Bacteroidetes bacterium HGW-Bacteroidetes-4]
MENMLTVILGILGGQEIILIVLAILILFGGRKIPELMKGLGKGIKEFKQATSDSGVGEDIKDIKKEINSVKNDITDSAKL